MNFRTYILFCLVAVSTPRASAQWSPTVPTTFSDQRNALNQMRTQMNWFQNTAGTATGYGAQGYNVVWEQFQVLRNAYGGVKHTLTPQQSAKGANALAELDAGLDIIQEAFANFQNDVNAGRNANVAFRDMCQVLRQATRVWAQQFNKTSSQLRIGLG